MGFDGDETTRAEAISQIRRIRAQTGLGRSGLVGRHHTVESPLLNAAVSDELDTVRAKYEMELAAHRDTTRELLDEKDRRIAQLEEMIALLRDRAAPMDR